MSSSIDILLRPRPYANLSGNLLLLPLLPQKKPLKPLPSEIWTIIISHALVDKVTTTTQWPWSLLTICKAFKEIALPVLYSNARMSHITALEKFHDRLHIADQMWDSIRRIPYSTPGRWVQTLDLSGLVFTGQPQALILDSLLTKLFPLIPFLAYLFINPSFVLSRRALASLASREGAANIRALEGLCYLLPPSPTPDQDPFVQLLRRCPNLTFLEVIGQGPDPAELEFNYDDSDPFSMEAFKPLELPKLEVLTLLSMHNSPLMRALLASSLRSLRKLTLTPYDDVPYPASLVSHFISAQGETLRSLLLFTPKSWPTRLHPSPETLLITSPKLRHLSLENPLPNLSVTETHPIQILSIPRPNVDFWRVLERLFPHVPNLSILRMRDVRWLRKGMTTMAQGAGVQGEMKEWQRRLARRRIRLVDTDWNESEK
ncbi:hypothetical protein BDQ12DRAFT_677437 [Crucibulum laeve]|uniref:F-box domain-containing protein n=1 Tax=Crucibulum laeve TaxID=68775 RepID=A0A5C3M927_9AGAR|nr:hypothetical protein BDQ12DRAFT_677437 [Crucibulum laeve]